MPTDQSARPVLRDVTLRDGLQLARGSLTTDQKLALLRTLLESGIPSVEVGAVVRPDLVPAMADTLELLVRLDDPERAIAWVLVPNLKGAQMALDAGARNLEMVLSVSDAHNRANVGRSTAESLAGLPAIAALTDAAGARLQVSLSTAFSCPFTGPVAPERVLALLDDPAVVAADSVALCDTLGQAAPGDVTALTHAARALLPHTWLVYHGHDTWGQGVANAIAALAAGADTVDGALGGLGGCPFAPGASGNTATEDLLYALRPDWLTPERFHDLARASSALVEVLGEPQRSRAAEAAALTTGPHPWAMPSHQVND